MDNKQDFLKPPPRLRWGRWILVSSVALALGAFHLLMSYDWDFQKLYQNARTWMNWIGALLGSVYASLIAALIWALMTRNTDESRLKTIRSLAHPDFTNAFFNELEILGGSYIKNYHIEVTLSPNPNNKQLCRCSIKYSYEKAIKDGRLIFCIARVRKAKQKKQLPSVSEAFFCNEFYFSLDEINISPVPDEAEYLVEDVVIGHNKVVMEPASKRSEGLFLEYGARPTSKLADGELVRISYRVHLPLEIESMLSLNVELPTKDIRISVDAQAMGEDFEIASHSMFTPWQGPNDVSDGRDRKIDIAYDGWLFPKNGIVCAWWRRNDSGHAL